MDSTSISFKQMHGSNIYEPKSKKCELNFSNRFLKKNSKDGKKKKKGICYEEGRVLKAYKNKNVQMGQ